MSDIEAKENDSSAILNTPAVALNNINKLEYAYSFWFSKRPGKSSAGTSNTSSSTPSTQPSTTSTSTTTTSTTPAAGTGVAGGGNVANYDANLRLVGTFDTVEKFWSYYCHMARPQDINGHADIHLFKDGIRPLWEDDANKNGGKWIVRLKKGLSSRCWENLILAILGEQFMVGEEICGAVVSVRFQEDLISVWNRTCSNQAVTSRIKDTLKRILNLPPSTILEYKSHNDSLKDNSSFRNTFYCDK